MELNRFVESAPTKHTETYLDYKLRLEAKIKEYSDFVKRASKGERFVYYTGLSPRENHIAGKVAEHVQLDYQNGLVFPFTKRVGNELFNYLVIRSGVAI